jgi:hypothetical protein
MFKKIVLTATILAAFTLLIVFKANAAPFLVTDPQSGVVGYEITGSITANFIAQPDGSLKYDLASAPNGENDIQIAACNVWGCSSTVPFVFNKAIPAAPAGLRIAAE